MRKPISLERDKAENCQSYAQIIKNMTKKDMPHEEALFEIFQYADQIDHILGDKLDPK